MAETGGESIDPITDCIIKYGISIQIFLTCTLQISIWWGDSDRTIYASLKQAFESKFGVQLTQEFVELLDLLEKKLDELTSICISTQPADQIQVKVTSVYVECKRRAGSHISIGTAKTVPEAIQRAHDSHPRFYLHVADFHVGYV